jgi:hypothetical protein
MSTKEPDQKEPDIEITITGNSTKAQQEFND